MNVENGNPPAGQGIGHSLVEAREGRGLSLREVEERTRIRSRYLRALEREEFDVLPAVYVLGSLKTYADSLGLDGAALSRQLKAGLVEAEEPEDAAQPAASGGRRDGDDGYGVGPVWAIGFDQLFLGMGVILISILAIMTLVAAIAQEDVPPISQVDEPSTPETPYEMALAENVADRVAPQPRRAGDEPNADAKERAGKDEPQKSKKDGNGEDQDKKEGQASIFGDVEFVPMSPSSSPTASASAAAASTAPSSASSGPSSPPPATAEPEDSSASPAPTDIGEAPPEPDPGSASAAAPTGPGVGARPSRPGPVATGSGDGISARIEDKIDEAFGNVGLD